MKPVAVHRPSMIWLVLTSLVVIAFGVVTSGLWYPALVILASPGTEGEGAVLAFAVYSSAGPVAALLGLVVGWVRVVMGRRYSGLKWMIALPLIWLIGLFGWLAIVNTVCDGRFDCGA